MGHILFNTYFLFPLQKKVKMTNLKIKYLNFINSLTAHEIPLQRFYEINRFSQFRTCKNFANYFREYRNNLVNYYIVSRGNIQYT